MLTCTSGTSSFDAESPRALYLDSVTICCLQFYGCKINILNSTKIKNGNPVKTTTTFQKK